MAAKATSLRLASPPTKTMSKHLNPTENQNKAQPPPRAVIAEGEKDEVFEGSHDSAARFAGGMEVMQQSMGNQALAGMAQRSFSPTAALAESDTAGLEGEQASETVSDLNGPISPGGVIQRSADTGQNAAQPDAELDAGEEREEMADQAFDAIMERAGGGEMPSGDGDGGNDGTIQRSLSTAEVTSDTLQTKRRRGGRKGGGRKRKARGGRGKKGGSKKRKSNKGGGGAQSEGGGGGIGEMLQGGAAEMLGGGGLEALMAGGNPMDMMMQMMGGGDPMQMMMQMMGGGGDMQAMMPLMMMMMQNKG